MAMTISLVTDEVHHNDSWTKAWRVIRWNIVATADTTLGTAVAISGVTGKVMLLQAIPLAADAPDDGWDVKLLDAQGFDILQAAGLNMPHTTASTNAPRKFPSVGTPAMQHVIFNEAVRLDITNFNASGTAQADVVLVLELP